MRKNNDGYQAFFISNSQEEIDKERSKNKAIMSLFPEWLGGIDHTKYVLVDDNSKMQGNNRKAGKSNGLTNRLPELENNDNSLNFGVREKEKTNISNEWLRKNALNGLENRSPKQIVKNVGQEPDSLWYDKGLLNVTFRNDVLKADDFDPFDSNDRAGCKRRCVTMLKRAGCELSGERIDMTVNNIHGEAVSASSNFQRGIDAINKALDKGQPIILNVDYKKGTAASADKAGDHFIIVTGKTIIDGETYYHFYDPATSHHNLGTANSNVLYIKDGFLMGEFMKYNGTTNGYKVTSVRLNK